jgi:hypothetical protein
VPNAEENAPPPGCIAAVPALPGTGLAFLILGTVFANLGGPALGLGMLLIAFALLLALVGLPLGVIALFLPAFPDRQAWIGAALSIGTFVALWILAATGLLDVNWFTA